MFTFSTGGLMSPPMVIYPYEGILSEITKTVSDDWGVGHSTTGWMTAAVFLNILDMFSLHTLENIMSSSLLSFFVNIHHTHLTHELIELCSVLSIN
jgi:hypothetical protein